MIACRLSYGVLVCIHHQPKANAKVIDFVEEFCDQLRTWYNYFAEQNKKKTNVGISVESGHHAFRCDVWFAK